MLNNKGIDTILNSCLYRVGPDRCHFVRVGLSGKYKRNFLKHGSRLSEISHFNNKLLRLFVQNINSAHYEFRIDSVLKEVL